MVLVDYLGLQTHVLQSETAGADTLKFLELRRWADISPSRNILILQCLLHQCLKYIASSPAMHVSPAVVVEFRAISSVLDYIASAPSVCCTSACDEIDHAAHQCTSACCGTHRSSSRGVCCTSVNNDRSTIARLAHFCCHEDRCWRQGLTTDLINMSQTEASLEDELATMQ